MAHFDGSANLIQNRAERSTPEERRANAQKAGLASGVARRKRRQMREIMAGLMTGSVGEPELRELLERAGIEATHENAISFAAICKAERGDIEAARFVRDTLGEKPTEAFNLSMSTKPIRALDLSQLTDEELEELADREVPEDLLPKLSERELEELADRELSERELD